MAQKIRFSLISIGLSFGVFASAFLGCYDTRTTQMGKCADDGNPCTIDSCESGGTLHINAPKGSGCTLGENAGFCDESGVCVLECEKQASGCICSSDEQCPADTACAESSCMNGQCITTFLANGTPTGIPAPGECQQLVCQDGATVPGPADFGIQCPTGVCNSTGMCVDCLPAQDWTDCGGASCGVKMCNGETSEQAGDCQSGFAADGVCCDTACTEVCKSCNVMGSVGTCTNIPYYQPDPSYIPQGGGAQSSCDYATAAAGCNGNGQCLKVSGASCTAGSQCMSGQCSMALKCLGAKGEFCTIPSDCVSGTCMMGTCT